MNRVIFCLFVIALVIVPFGKVQAAGDLDIKLDEPVSKIDENIKTINEKSKKIFCRIGR